MGSYFATAGPLRRRQQQKQQRCSRPLLLLVRRREGKGRVGAGCGGGAKKRQGRRWRQDRLQLNLLETAG